MENLNVQNLVRTTAAGAHLLYVVTGNERYTAGIVARAAASLEGVGAVYIFSPQHLREVRKSFSWVQR